MKLRRNNTSESVIEIQEPISQEERRSNLRGLRKYSKSEKLKASAKGRYGL
jgi:hypothetical protein